MKKCFHGGIAVLASSLILSLAACTEKNRSDEWYMQHPMALKNAVIACQSAAAPKNQEQCDKLYTLATQMQDIITDQQTHPEDFGQRLIDEEIAGVKLHEAVKQAESSLQTLQQKNAAADEIKSAQEVLSQAKDACKAQKQKINIMLAVIALSSPE